MVFTSLATHLGSTLWNFAPSFPWQQTLAGLAGSPALRTLVREYAQEAYGATDASYPDGDDLPMTQSVGGCVSPGVNTPHRGSPTTTCPALTCLFSTYRSPGHHEADGAGEAAAGHFGALLHSLYVWTDYLFTGVCLAPDTSNADMEVWRSQGGRNPHPRSGATWHLSYAGNVQVSGWRSD
jgi:hypothetical protein